MTAPDIDNLMSALKKWTAEKYGRQSEIAREVGVSRHLVNDWIAGRRPPSLDQYLKLQAFVKKQRSRNQ
jgi:predicted transcriptional regulator